MNTAHMDMEYRAHDYRANAYRANTSRAIGGGLGSRPKKMYVERLGDGVEYHLMRTTPRC